MDPRCPFCQELDEFGCRCPCGACDAANQRILDKTGNWLAAKEAAADEAAPTATPDGQPSLTRCFNKACGFLVHDSDTGEFGEFCCHTCWKQFNETGGDVDLLVARGQKHGVRCQRQVAPAAASYAAVCQIPLSERVLVGSASSRAREESHPECPPPPDGPPTHPECPPPPDGPPTTASLVWHAVQMAEQAYHAAVMRRDTIRMVMAQAENHVMEANRFYRELVQLQRRFIDDIQNRNLDNGQ